MGAIAAVFLALIALGGALPQTAMGQENLKKHAAITGERRPALCTTKDAVALIVSIIERAAEQRTRGSADKAKSLYEIAARLQGEICEKPAAEDAVIVRCSLGRREIPNGAVSLLKVTAIIRAEITKGEQSFYSWSYLPLLDGTGSETENAALDKRWCEDDAGDKPLVATPDKILQVQSRFYDLGINIGAINGQMTPETIRAITQFQRWAKLPTSGELTELTFTRLNAVAAPSPWVAVAFDGAGAYGYVKGSATRRVAEAGAVTQLRTRSQSEYRLSSAAAPNCIGIATTSYSGRNNGRRVRYTQAFTSIASSAEVAKSNVVAYCNQQKGGGTCQLKDAICAAATPSREDGDRSINAGPSQRPDPNAPITANTPAPQREDPTWPSKNQQRFDANEPLTANSPPPIAVPE